MPATGSAQNAMLRGTSVAEPAKDVTRIVDLPIAALLQKRGDAFWHWHAVRLELAKGSFLRDGLALGALEVGHHLLYRSSRSAAHSAAAANPGAPRESSYSISRRAAAASFITMRRSLRSCG